MKISFPSYSSGTLLTRKQGASSIISSIIIGLFAGIGGGYFLENNFTLPWRSRGYFDFVELE
jgi:hypothetical protein